jgi:hypothetical protein
MTIKKSCIDAIGLELILIVTTVLSSYLRNVDVSYDKPLFLVFYANGKNDIKIFYEPKRYFRNSR